MTNPFHIRGNQSWEWPVASLCLVLGVMVSLAWIGKANRESRFSTLDADMAGRISRGEIDEVELRRLSSEVSKLREENTKLQNAVAGNSQQSRVLNEALQQVKTWSGLTAIEGPGITVTLTDSQNMDLLENDRIIHDNDLMRIVNELWASGAEAIEINGHRLVARSTIRCVGPVIQVDARVVSVPVHIRAIGDIEDLYGALNFPGGVAESFRELDPTMFKIDRVKLHHFKAFSGSTELRTAKIPPEANKKP
ncbi:MAG: DUF881 domain-containing protein [Fimbriimonadaceae bacterium]